TCGARGTPCDAGLRSGAMRRFPVVAPGAKADTTRENQRRRCAVRKESPQEAGMPTLRLPVSPATAILLILAMPVMARAQTSPDGVYMLDRAASTVGFTLY